MSHPWNAGLGRSIPLLVVFFVGCGSQVAPAEEPEEPEPDTEDSSAVPTEVLENITTAGVTLTVQPVTAEGQDPGPGLRSVLLHVEGSHRLEPHARWPDGSPVSADDELSREQMLALLEAMAGAGYFARSTRYAAVRHRSPLSSPPADARHGAPSWPPEPHLRVEVRVHDVDWYHLWVAPVGLSDGAARLEVIASALEADAAELVRALAAQATEAAGTDPSPVSDSGAD